MATLRHRNGSYFVDYRINGRRFRKDVGRSKRIAELALKDLEVKIAKGELGQMGASQALRQWLHRVESSGIENHVIPSVSPLERYQQDTFVDPPTGQRMQMNAKGEYVPVQSSDTVSAGRAGGGTGPEDHRRTDLYRSREVTHYLERI